MRSGGRIRGAEDTDGARGPAGWGRSWTSEPGCCRGGCKQSAGLGELWNARLAIGLVCVAAIHHVGEREGERGGVQPGGWGERRGGEEERENDRKQGMGEWKRRTGERERKRERERERERKRKR